MKSRTTKIILSLVIILSILVIGYTVFASQTRRAGRMTIEQKEKIIDKRVEEKKITSDQAKEIKEQLKNCDSNNPRKLGQKYNLHFGQENGKNGQGQKNGNGQKQGQRLRDGSCGNCQKTTQVTQ